MRGLVDSKGVYKLWSDIESDLSPNRRPVSDGLVWTFNVAPDSVYGQRRGFRFDAYAF